jgi:hypothetical protein
MRSLGLIRKHHDILPVQRSGKPGNAALDIKIRRVLCALSCAAFLLALSVPSESQSTALQMDFSGTASTARPGQLYGPYVRPTQSTMARNYLFDAFGPYPIVGAAIFAGINQASNAPPEWNQGFDGYSKRMASNYGISMVATTTRYGLSQILREDAMYYRCDCRGVFPRVRHALISTLTARRGEDGHRVFSVPALVGPYAGTMTGTYAWYPHRYGVKDAFRAGNYSLLAIAGQNISLEFLYSGPHALLSRMHLNNRHGAPIEGPYK